MSGAKIDKTYSFGFTLGLHLKDVRSTYTKPGTPSENDGLIETIDKHTAPDGIEPPPAPTSYGGVPGGEPPDGLNLLPDGYVPQPETDSKEITLKKVFVALNFAIPFEYRASPAVDVGASLGITLGAGDSAFLFQFEGLVHADFRFLHSIDKPFCKNFGARIQLGGGRTYAYTDNPHLSKDHAHFQFFIGFFYDFGDDRSNTMNAGYQLNTMNEVELDPGNERYYNSNDFKIEHTWNDAIYSD